MKSHFLTALQHITVPGDLGRGDRLNDDLFLTNNANVLDKILRPEVGHIIGILESTALKKAKAVVYSNEELPEDTDRHAHLQRRLEEVAAFQHTLWLWKDNCVDNELGFLVSYAKAGLSVESNYLVQRYSLSTGKIGTIEFTREDLKIIRRYFREQMVREFSEDRPPTFMTTDVNRVSRALFLAQSARIAGDLGFKIAGYCGALEALLTTSQSELAHQMSERAAFLIAENAKERTETYATLKKAYEVRSKIVHGGYIKGAKVTDLALLSTACDEIVRRCLQKVLGSTEMSHLFAGSQEELDAFLLDIIFGRSGVITT